MRFRIGILLCCLGGALKAQTEMNVQQLAEMIRSEVAMHQDDRKIGDFLKKVKLSEKLNEKTIQDLAAQGAGPRTVKALEQLKEQTANLKTPTGDATYSPGTAPDTTPPASTNATVGLKKEYQPIPPPDSVRQQEILDSIKQYALNYTQNLPNFVCTQVTRRYVDPFSSDRYRLIETDVVAVSYTGGREKYEVKLVNNRPVNMSMDELGTHGGTVSSGEFGNLMAKVFEEKSSAQFGWDHWATLRGQRMAVFNYFIDSGHSSYSISFGGTQEIITAYRGLIYADEHTGAVSRITFDAVDIPKSFPVSFAREILDYDDVDISGKKYVCPLKADLRLTAGQQKTKNDIEFRLYKKFGTESTITFDTPEPLPDDKTKEQPAAGAATPNVPPPPPK